MSWPRYLDRVTVMDVLEEGACPTGVLRWIDAQPGRPIAGEAEAYRSNEWVARAARADGYGDGYGSGSGDGYGSGYGSGSGDG